MKAIGTIDSSKNFIDFEIEKPILRPHDLLIKVEAISIKPKILGWDGLGTVVELGSETKLFKVGDKVFWAGDVTRSGSNAEFQAVDERIVGFAPKNLTKEKAVAMPLTSLTAYELLFEKLEVTDKSKGKSLLIINGAGGVGSVAIQMAKNAGLTVIATASNPQAIEWVKNFGADYTVNHHEKLVPQVHELGFKFVDYILILNAVVEHMPAVNELIAPQGSIANIVEPGQAINLDQLAHKSARFNFEWMFTKVVSNTSDLQSQHDILNKVSEWLDNDVLKSTMTQNLGPITAENVKKAHELIEENHTIGKIILS